jgi:hypothetical protein
MVHYNYMFTPAQLAFLVRFLVASCLEKLPAKMAPGGILHIDDCAPAAIFDGALQAYSEFVAKHAVRTAIVCGKLGII